MVAGQLDPNNYTNKLHLYDPLYFAKSFLIHYVIWKKIAF